MKFNTLTPIKRRSVKRIGRGISAGQGKTAGRGTKGQNARTGGQRRPGFEGGQNPMYMRLPKTRGFRSLRPKSENIYTGQLDGLGPKITNHTLAEAGLVSSPFTAIKLITKGKVTKKVSVSLQAASEQAISLVQKAGGSFVKVPQIKRPAAAKKSD